MHINSYGWVILIILCMALLVWIGGEMNFTVNEVSYQGDTLTFLSGLAFGQIDGMPLIFTIIFDFIPVFMGWIIYRQVRGQD